MNRSLEQIGLSRDAEITEIGRLLIEQVAICEREFDQLKAELRSIAHQTRDVELVDWLRIENSRLDEESNAIQNALTTLEEVTMKMEPSANYEEAVRRLEHVEALAKLTRHKIELHVQFLRESNARLKDKLAEVQHRPTQ
jgi:transcriptional regulator of aromatic amino acid metabolism